MASHLNDTELSELDPVSEPQGSTEETDYIDLAKSNISEFRILMKDAEYAEKRLMKNLMMYIYILQTPTLRLLGRFEACGA